MYQSKNMEPPWGDAMLTQPACCGASGISAWVQDHLWLSLALALAAGWLVGGGKK